MEGEGEKARWDDGEHGKAGSIGMRSRWCRLGSMGSRTKGRKGGLIEMRSRGRGGEGGGGKMTTLGATKNLADLHVLHPESLVGSSRHNSAWGHRRQLSTTAQHCRQQPYSSSPSSSAMAAEGGGW